MPVETLHHPEIVPFIANWTGKPPGQIAEELASHSLETKGIPDPYYFLVTTTGELFSPSAQCRVKDVVLRTNHLGQLEYQALRFIEQWVAGSSEGTVAWISPPYPGIYPVSKIIISEIEYMDGEKRLFNRAIILDFGEQKCLEFAQSLARYSQNRPLLSHLDEVRSQPLILNPCIPWIHILGELIDDPVLWDSIRNGEDQRVKEEAVRQAGIVLKGLFEVTTDSNSMDYVRMAVAGMLGGGPGSCPVRFDTQGTAFQLFSKSALTFAGSVGKDADFCQACPVCGQEINCIVRMGGSCPKCKAVRKCG